ncbi:hypothetical protein like AT5G42930 [Hibiscus trionum]|uniref:Fungal lipase-type domain-containing protein n=1 Tax=Hibiscus trionum TaxID=183268 RepID=A0A9W7M6E5_HIBTR|nr:hypothetical protein like AT5G42930 [Hibiscus trionum]
MSVDENRFYDDCFIVRLEDASFFDLCGLLFSSKLGRRNFIDCPRQFSLGFARRLIIFFSVLVLKLILLMRVPLLLGKDAIEMFLNLLSLNGGLFGFPFKLMTGKLVWPDKSSAKFKSMLSFIESRVELDNNIKPGDSKYKASLCIMAAKSSYDQEARIKTVVIEHWKMKFLKFYEFWNDFENRASTQAFMMQDTHSNPNLIVVAFRGTEPFSPYDLRVNFDISWYELKGMEKGKTHSGFLKALGLQKNKGFPKDLHHPADRRQFAYYTLRRKLREVLQVNREARLILTGHSSGGALAILFASLLALHEEEWLLERLEAVYTFGQPRVGDSKFVEFMDKKLSKFDVKYYRYVYNNDIVARIPYDDSVFSYKHFGTCIFFNSRYKGKVLAEEPDKNFYPWVLTLPKMMDAVWEFIRGFILPFKHGPGYKETLLMKLTRIGGFALPGMANHMPPDYVNSTRLGTLPPDQLKRD